MSLPEEPAGDDPNKKQGGGASLLRRLFSFRILWRAALISIALILTFYGEENWRGHRAWTKYVQEKTAQGLHRDWKSCIPPVVPDADNFAMTPVLAARHKTSNRISMAEDDWIWLGGTPTDLRKP